MGWRFDLCSGHLALDFANTVSGRAGDRPIERLPSYDELVAFAEQTGLADDVEAARLREAAGRDPAGAARVLAGAVALREATFALFHAIASRGVPAAADLAILNEHVARLHVGPDLEWRWIPRDDGLDAPLGPVVRAAALLLTSPDREKIRLCEAPGCVWLFFDASRNRSRRWCDMRQCGNRMKARRHYERTRRAPG